MAKYSHDNDKKQNGPPRVAIWMVTSFSVLFGGGFSSGVVGAPLQGFSWRVNSK